MRAMLRTDLIACQLFSETEAGLRPRRGPDPGRPRGTTTGCSTATRCGPPGPRSPTSASRSRRTDPAAAKHAGLTVFLVPMDAPGVTVRPIRQMTGGSSLQRGLPRRRRALRRPPAGSGRPGLEGRTDRAGRRAPRLRQPRPGQRRPRGRAGPPPRPPAHRARAGPGRRPGDPQLRPAAHRHARRRRARRRGATPDPRPRWASCSPPTPWPGPPRSPGMLLGPRLAADGGGWGTWAWTRAPARRARLPHRRRHRRDPAQHHRRARARPAPGAPAAHAGRQP